MPAIRFPDPATTQEFDNTLRNGAFYEYSTTFKTWTSIGGASGSGGGGGGGGTAYGFKNGVGLDTTDDGIQVKIPGLRDRTTN